MIACRAVDPKLTASSIRSILASLDPTLPVELETMQQRVHEIDQGPRFYTILLAVFAAMGLLIAAVGLFGVMSFLVAQRTREIEVRLALGATPARIVLDARIGCALDRGGNRDWRRRIACNGAPDSLIAVSSTTG